MKKSITLITGIVTFFLLTGCVSYNSLRSLREPKIRIETTEGEIVVKLYNETPLHRDNFLRLVKHKLYEGVIFHRVIDNFMIQGGDPDTRTAEQKSKINRSTPEYTIPAEIRTPAIYHKKGALAAARLGDSENPLKASSGYQFYIVEGKKFTQDDLTKMQSAKIANYQKIDEQTADSLYKFRKQARLTYEQTGGTPHLDGNYTVFGEVIDGQDIVDKIAETATDNKDKPLKEIRIVKMTKIR
jgi:peptidyl-prolyl cis-trans isomerase B (cyclophilin B)